MEKGFILSLVFAAIVGIFALKNSDKVLIDLFFTKLEMSQAIVIFISALLGAVIAAVLGWVKTIKLKKDIKELNKRVEAIETEKNKLSNLLEAKEEIIMQKTEKNIEDLSQNSETDNNN